MEISNKIQSLYDDIKSSNTNDEIDQLIYLLTKNENESVNSNISFEIRILSSNEYNKYIINGTCNGSIINCDENVWHSINYDRSLFVYYNSTDWTPYKGLEVNLLWYGDRTPYGTAILQCNNVTIVKVGDSESYGTIFYYYYSIVQDNSGNLCSISNKTVILECLGRNRNLTRSINDYNVYYLGVFSEVSKSAVTYTLPNLTGHHYHGHGLQNIWITPIIYNGFRPVFQYVDNRKSKNIFT